MKMNDFPNIERLNPKDCIAGKIGRCNRIISSVFRKHLFPFGISNSQYSILMVITKKGKVDQNELGKILLLEKSSLSRNLKRLIDQKLIQKIGKTLSTTLKGKEFIEPIIPAWENAMDEIKTKLSTEGIDSINTTLQLLNN